MFLNLKKSEMPFVSSKINVLIDICSIRLYDKCKF